MPFGKRRPNIILNGLKHPNAKEVRVSIVFTRLGEIDTINERFSCEATLFITWRESTNILQKHDGGSGDNSYVWDSNKLWDPQLYIDNAIGDVKEKDVKFRLEKLFDDMKKEWFFEVHMIKRIQGTFFEKLELYHFPFDIQDLSITLTSHRTQDEIVLVQDFNIPPKMTKSASLDKHIWKLYDHVNIKTHTIRNDLPLSSDYSNEEFETACSHSALTMQCRVSRKPGYFIINCLLPTLMITLCVFFTFMMDYQRFQYRFSLLFTTMLTSITFRWAIHGRVLPTISYMTFLDVYCVSSIMIVFSAMLWHACYLLIYKQNELLAEECDTYAMITFAIIVFIIHIMQTIWFVIAFRKRLELEKLDKKAALNYLKARMSVSKINKTTASISGNSIVSSVNNNTDSIKKLQLRQKKQHLHQETRNSSNEPSFNRYSKNTADCVKSKRILYSLSKTEDNSIITVHTSNERQNTPTVHSNSSEVASPSYPNNIHNSNAYDSLEKAIIASDSSKLSRNESTMTGTSTSSNTNLINRNASTNNSNLLLKSKSNSFTNPNNLSLNEKSEGRCDYNSNYNVNGLINCNNSNKNLTVTGGGNSSQQHQKHHNHYHKIKNKSNPLLDVNRLNVSGTASHSLDSQYIPLIHQSTRDFLT